MTGVQLESVIFWAAVTLYVAAAALAVFSLVLEKERLQAWVVWVSLGAVAVHAAAITLRWIDVGHGPYISQHEAMSSNAFVVITIWLITQVRWPKLRSVGPYVLAAAVIALGVAALSPRAAQDLPLTFQSYWLLIHIGFAKLANGSLLVGAACAALFLYEDRRMRLGKTGQFIERALPDADWLDESSYRFTALGFIFLALMIGAGAIWANKSWGRYWGWDPIETWSLVTWIVYGVYLHLRRTFGWTGRRGAYLLLACLLLAIFSFFLIGVVATALHVEFMQRG
jgi:cytochrome c-type biogenesis protein CcsB